MRILTKRRIREYWENHPQAEQNMIASTQQLSEPVTIRPVITAADYEDTPAELDSMIGHVEPGTPDGNRYELLASMVEAYEEEHHPIERSDDPIAMIQFALEARGLTRKDLEAYIGTRQRVWDIMERRRSTVENKKGDAEASPNHNITRIIEYLVPLRGFEPL